DAHPTGPAVGQGSVQVVLDVVEPVQHRPLLAQWDLVGLEGRLGLLLRSVTRDLHGDPVCHGDYLPYTRSPGGQRVIVTGRYPTRPVPSGSRWTSEWARNLVSSLAGKSVR